MIDGYFDFWHIIFKWLDATEVIFSSYEHGHQFIVVIMCILLYIYIMLIMIKV